MAEGATPLSAEQARTAEAYEREDTVEFYESFHDGLFPGEQVAFERVLRSGMRILDLGVGAGRTTPALSALAEESGRYVGLDYSQKMVSACRRRFPGLEFVQGDASDLSLFGAASFDAVVYSFNGIDCLHPDAKRLDCLAECHRVLAPGGALVLSSHNPQAMVVPPRAWRGEPAKRKAKRSAIAVRDSAVRTAALVRQRLLWSRQRYYLDALHGGAWYHASTRAAFVGEVTAAGFRLVGEPIAFDHPRPALRFVTGWFVYPFRRA